MFQAITSYHAPEQYGGDKVKGLKQMETAIAAFRKQKISDPLYPEWGFEDSLMMMATWKIRMVEKQQNHNLE